MHIFFLLHKTKDPIYLLGRSIFKFVDQQVGCLLQRCHSVVILFKSKCKFILPVPLPITHVQSGWALKGLKRVKCQCILLILKPKKNFVYFFHETKPLSGQEDTHQRMLHHKLSQSKNKKTCVHLLELSAFQRIFLVPFWVFWFHFSWSY